MKKILLILLALSLFLTGCNNLDDTPNKKVEAFFNNYQTLDNTVLDDLDEVVTKETRFTAEQRERYKKLMKKQYQGLSYEIKDDMIDGDTAIVTVEIKVNDFSKVLTETDAYLQMNPNEFKDDAGIYSEEKYMDYRLERLEKSNEKIKYTLEITLTKRDNEWTIDNLSTNDLDKINGIYNA